MKSLSLFIPFLFASSALASSLVNFSASTTTDVSILGIRDLEAARGDKPDENTDDIYIKLGKDPKGIPALHFHRIAGDIRAEYHVLPKKTEAGKTYYIGYKFSLAEIQKSLMIWQFKEYVANNNISGGANIPLAFEIQGGQLQFQYQASNITKRVAQWSTTVENDTTYSAGIVINTSQPNGWVQLYWQGKLQTFDTTKSTNLTAKTFPGRADPKFGAYEGYEVDIDTYVYDFKIGTTLDDIKDVIGI